MQCFKSLATPPATLSLYGGVSDIQNQNQTELKKVHLCNAITDVCSKCFTRILKLGKYIDLPQGGLSSDIILNTRMTSKEEDYCWNQPTSVGQHWLAKITILFEKQFTHLRVKLSDAIQLIEPNCACLLISNFLENCSQLLLHSNQPTEI